MKRFVLAAAVAALLPLGTTASAQAVASPLIGQTIGSVAAAAGVSTAVATTFVVAIGLTVVGGVVTLVDDATSGTD